MQVIAVKDANILIDCVDIDLLEVVFQLPIRFQTGDGKLRKICRQDDIPVHGILWLQDEALRLGLIDSATACAKINQLASVNPRLPRNAVRERMQRWCHP